MGGLKATTPLLTRGVAFLILFVVISGLLGPRIINSDILFRDGFGIYGGLGKAVIFGLIAFVLLARKQNFDFKLKAWQPVLSVWLGLSLLFGALAWWSISQLLSGQENALNIVLAHSALWLSVGCGAVGCFGPHNITLIVKKYKQQLLQAAVIAGLFYIFLTAVYALWKPLASIVLVGVDSLLNAVKVPTEIMMPNTLLTDKFGITVAQYCSGIESIALFSGLYIIVGLLDAHRLNLQRYLMVFPLALVILFGLNILRVFALILAGYSINPQIAFSLFHTYAGMVFFILYSAAFWVIAYKYLVNNRAEPETSDDTYQSNP